MQMPRGNDDMLRERKQIINMLDDVCENCHKTYGNHFHNTCPSELGTPNRIGMTFKPVSVPLSEQTELTK
jgi:hypothetical protein